MMENIEFIGNSRLRLTQKTHAVKAFEIPRIDLRMMCADIYQSDLRKFDSWMRGKTMGWLKLHGIPREVFLMSWKDSRFTLPSLEERQQIMVIRTILDMFCSTDTELVQLMRQVDTEESEIYHCGIVERQGDLGGFLRWDSELPDLRTRLKKENITEDEVNSLSVFRHDLSILPLALRAFQDLDLNIWVTGTTAHLAHKTLRMSFDSSKITRPTTWIIQEIIRKGALNSFKRSDMCSQGWQNLEDSPSANCWLN
jgi:hypothetical protein